MVEPASFGLLLRRRRLEAALSQETLAERAGISPAAVSAYERGIRIAPHRATLVMLADVLDLAGAARAEFEASGRKRAADGGAARRMQRSTNIPLALDSFVGRVEAVADVHALLHGHRLVTIAGDGGVGKTRLASAVASELLPDYPDGVWLADLGSLSKPEDVVPLVAALLHVDAKGETQTLAAAITDRTMLIVLDSCEHVIEAAAELARALTRTCPSITVVATSRARLRIAGEIVYVLPPLALPPALHECPNSAARYPAVRLFIDRTQARDARLTLTEKRLPTIVEICRQVDGMPLAIEIVASRVIGVGLDELRKQLSQFFALELEGNRDLPLRQRTMRNTLDWSYETLDRGEQLVFQRLSTFAGGWTLEAAQTVCSDEALSEEAIRDRVAGLVEKSLIRCDVSADVPRYSMLQIHRLFAEAKLHASGEADRLFDRHARWVEALAQHADAISNSSLRSDWFNAFEPELENIRVALHRTLERPDNVARAVEILHGFIALWNGMASEFRWYLQQIEKTLDTSVESMTVVRFLAHHALFSPHDVGVTYARRAVALDRSLNGSASHIAVRNLAFILRSLRRYDEAEAALDDVFAYLDRTGALRSRYAILAHSERMDLAKERGRYEQALSEAEVAFAIAEERREPYHLASINYSLADVHFEIGDTERAATIADLAVEQARAVSNRLFEMWALMKGAAYRIVCGDVRGAVTRAREALLLARRRDPVAVFGSLETFAAIAAVTRDLLVAARIAGFAEATFLQLHVTRGKIEERVQAITMDALRAGLADDVITNLMSRGASDDEDDIVNEALAITVPEK